MSPTEQSCLDRPLSPRDTGCQAGAPGLSIKGECQWDSSLRMMDVCASLKLPAVPVDFQGSSFSRRCSYSSSACAVEQLCLLELGGDRWWLTVAIIKAL
ncbi:hypothetical protein GN956_G14141 [Arapaima gigas]